jgi:hypothetical protein
MATLDAFQDQIKTQVRKEILTSVKKVEGYSTKQGEEPIFLLAYIGFVIFASIKMFK